MCACFTLVSGAKEMEKKQSDADVGSFSCQNLLVPTQENTSSSLRNRCSSLGASLNIGISN